MRLAGNPETKQMLGHIRVVGNDPHAESLGTLGHHASDTAQPHDPQGLVGQLHALPTCAVPRTADQIRVGLRHIARLSQQIGWGLGKAA